MNFHFTGEENRLIEQIHKFAVDEVAPMAAELDREERFPSESLNRLREMGMMGASFLGSLRTFRAWNTGAKREISCSLNER